jgi:transposase InsO family protein
MIQHEEATHAVRTMCRALGVSTSGYYAWRSRPASARATEDRRLSVAIRAIHRESRGTYGAPRVHAELRERGVACSRKRVARLMREGGVSGKAPRRRKRGEPTGPLAPVAENVLDRQFQPAAPDQAWAADITQVWTGEGWLYLAVVLDLFSRRVVGWTTRSSLSRALAIEALRNALRSRRPPPGLLQHSDQGTQYTSHEYQALLRHHGLVCSMSRRGNCHDNAPTESFFGSLKSELVYGRRFETQGELRSALFDYIEGFYNTRRRHTSLGFLTPAEHEARHHAQRALTPAA